MRKRFLGLNILVVFTFALANAQQPAPSIEPPDGQRILVEVHAEGVQIYSCAVESGKPAWKFQGPEAKLTNLDGSTAGTHSSGPTWKLVDGSEVKGGMATPRPAPDAGSIPWLLVKVASHRGEGKLSQAEYVTRTDTKGGVAPQAGCDGVHAGTIARVPYSATYRFYGK